MTSLERRPPHPGRLVGLILAALVGIGLILMPFVVVVAVVAVLLPSSLDEVWIALALTVFVLCCVRMLRSSR